MSPHPDQPSSALRRRFLKQALAGGLATAGLAARRAIADEEPAAEELSGRLVLRSARSARADLDGVFLYDLKAGSWQKITDDTVAVGRASRDGRMLAYLVATGPIERQGLWTCPTDGGEPKRIIERKGVMTWSPDGRQIAVSARRVVDNIVTCETWRMNADGSSAERLAVPDTDNVMDWSPDGQWLLAATLRGGSLRAPNCLSLIHPDGTGRREMLEGKLRALFARFSPDGRSVLYHQLRDTDRYADLARI
ncbi:MAG TPA: hypothetical protein VGZ22_21290, partial [Isosphaeraceae bacterium]|nr:hypothetical protein [Isosphaeraceae bacterium]